MDQSYIADYLGNLNSGLTGERDEVNTALAIHARHGLFNFKGTNTKFIRRALGNARAGVGHAVVLGVGDSTCAGLTTGVANLPPTSWMKFLADILSAKGYSITYDARFGDAGAVSSASTANITDPRVTLGSGWGNGGPFGVGGQSFQNSTTTNALSLAVARSFDTIDLYYIQNTGLATFTVNVDGGAALATINSAGGQALIKTTISCPAGVHTININRTGTGASAFIVGIDPYTDGTKSVRLINGGACSSRAQHWAANSLVYDPIKQIIAIAAPLVVLDLGINDGVAARTKAELTADLQTIITAQKTVGDIFLKIPLPSETSVISAQIQSDYREAYYQLAVENDVPLIDLPLIMGPWAIQLSGVMSDPLHGTASTYADEGRIIDNAMSF